MLCETIAIGCLVAHGDIVDEQKKSFEKEWAADKILKQLALLNPHFYPQQATIGDHTLTANTNSNALKKDELFKLYGKCGDALPRGALKKVLSCDPIAHGRLDEADIAFWTQKVEDLLGTHIIPLADRVLLLCVLRDSGKNMDTTVKRIELGPASS